MTTTNNDALILLMEAAMEEAGNNDATWERAVALREAIALMAPVGLEAIQVVLLANVDNALQLCDGLMDPEAQAGIEQALRLIREAADGMVLQ